jgi:hypothetical protein
MSYYRISLVHSNESVISSNSIAIEQQFQNDLEIVKAYPNPASTNLTVISSSKTENTYQLTLSNLNGKKVFDQNLTFQKGLNQTSIDGSQIGSGFYLLSTSLNGKNISIQKIIIE